MVTNRNDNRAGAPSGAFALPKAFIEKSRGLFSDEAEFAAFLSAMADGNAVRKSLRINPRKVSRAVFLRLPAVAAWALSDVPWEKNGFYFGWDAAACASGDMAGFGGAVASGGEAASGEAADFSGTVAAPGKHPYHEAGVYYIQEASAMLPVSELALRERGSGGSDAGGTVAEGFNGSGALARSGSSFRVLDLCAAPGGKATQIASYLSDDDILFANEPVSSRAKILSENIERFGVRNAVVLSEQPARLATRFPDFFDRVLVDAPCSGEGMFRRHPEAISEWSPEKVSGCAARQAEILDAAAVMLRADGRMVYSTCTFSREENEDTVAAFLSRHADFSLIETRRVFPQDRLGEGHFCAVLVRGGESVAKFGRVSCSAVETKQARKRSRSSNKASGKTVSADISLCTEFLRDMLVSDDLLSAFSRITLRGNECYVLPSALSECETSGVRGAAILDGLSVLRAGLHLGTIKKNRFEPSHSLALTLSPRDVRRVYDLPSGISNDGVSSSDTAPAFTGGVSSSDAAPAFTAADFIRGETFHSDAPDGWHLITVDGFSLGWGKCAGGVMKNHYPKGLRKNL